MTRSSVRTAVELFHLPSRARQLRLDPVPQDIARLLQIAAGDEEAIEHARLESENPRDHILEAASFFIEQVLLTDPQDSYRVLGGTSSSSSIELRRNFGLLMRWLHPDGHPHEDQTIYARRVTDAWNDLKTPERRANYDAKLAKAVQKPRTSPTKSYSSRSLDKSMRHTHSKMHSRRRRPHPRKGLFQQFLSYFLS